MSNKQSLRDSILFALSTLGFALSCLFHLASYFGIIVPRIILILLAIMLPLASLPAYFVYLRDIYDFHGWEWPWENRNPNNSRIWRQATLDILRKQDYLKIGMPHAPSWLRSILPLLMLGSVAYVTGMSIASKDEVCCDIFYTVNSTTLFFAAFFLFSLSIFHSRI